MVYFGEFWFFCLRGKQRHPRVQLATLERSNPHALAPTALERQLCRSPLHVTRRNNRSEYGRVCGVEIGCRRLDRFTQVIRYQWVGFDVICPFSTVESVKNPPYAIVSQQKMVNFTAACAEQVYGNIAFVHTPTKIAVCAIPHTRMTRTKVSIALKQNGRSS